MIGASGPRACRISSIVLCYDSPARVSAAAAAVPFLMYMIPGLRQSPRNPNQGHENTCEPLRHLCFFPSCPPVLRNYFRPGSNQPVFSSQEQASSTSASRMHARPIVRTRLSWIMPRPYHAFFSKLYESAFRMEERMERIDDTMIGSVRKKNIGGAVSSKRDGGGCIGVVVVVVKEVVGKKGAAGFTACPSSSMGSCWRASPEGDAHRDFTRAGRGWYLASGQ